MDLLSLSEAENLGEMLFMAGRMNLGNWFAFEIEDDLFPFRRKHAARDNQCITLLDGAANSNPFTWIMALAIHKLLQLIIDRQEYAGDIAQRKRTCRNLIDRMVEQTRQYNNNCYLS